MIRAIICYSLLLALAGQVFAQPGVTMPDGSEQARWTLSLTAALDHPLAPTTDWRSPSPFVANTILSETVMELMPAIPQADCKVVGSALTAAFDEEYTRVLMQPRALMCGASVHYIKGLGFDAGVVGVQFPSQYAWHLPFKHEVVFNFRPLDGAEICPDGYELPPGGHKCVEVGKK